MMNINILTLKSPFSFFCENKDTKSAAVSIDERKLSSQMTTTAIHGQYVAVCWHKKWTRGIVTVERNIMIWLVDYGIYIRPDSSTLYVELPTEYKKHPSPIFEASIHGVVPLEKTLNEECHIVNKVTKTWIKAAIDKTQELIKSAAELYFEPVAMLTTKHNDVVLGNLYIKLVHGGVVNLIEELEKWPIFVEKNPDSYIKYLSAYYPNRKIHRACLEKPLADFSELTVLTIHDETLEEYRRITTIPTTIFNDDPTDLNSEIGSTVVGAKVKTKPFRLTAMEVSHYADMYIDINGVEYNALQLLLQKIKDLEMCEMYHDAESVGRGLTNRILYRNYL